MSGSTEVWSTIRISMRGVGTDEEALVAASERLEGLAALLADREEVGGVETRDPSLITEGAEFVAVERPELIAYSTPPLRAAAQEAARALARTLHLEVEIEGEDHEGDDWRDVWKRYHRSLYFHAAEPETLSFLVRPSWIERRADDPPLELVLDPGRAFGTGLHESTRLCLQMAVELAARTPDHAPSRVIDVGCGSGILGLAAARLWPQTERLVFADYDSEAVATARENAELNKLDDPERTQFLQLDLVTGTDDTPLAPAQLVFANIRPKVLIPAAARIIAMVVPGCLVALSGILEEEAEAVLAAYVPELELVKRTRDAGWTALLMRRGDSE